VPVLEFAHHCVESELSPSVSPVLHQGIVAFVI
jgi:hypothetical protein